MPSLSRPDPSKPSKRKALLIGIQESLEEVSLDCPHHDVMEMERLLVDKYGYDRKDIVVMRDGIGVAKLQPTRANILREVAMLVRDPQPGDRFVFHYAGHSTQQPTRSRSEEDKHDEYLVPIDAKGTRNLIKDNELRKLLVDGLPVGSILVAIIDSCHSESMLDLKHYRCNRIFTPWKSKGERKSDSKRNVVVRHNDMVVDRKQSTLIGSHQSKVASLKSRKPIARKSLQMCIAIGDLFNIPMRFCQSPAEEYCTGWCEPDPEKKAYVLCFSACKDRQIAWESSGDNETLTMAMIHILEGSPNPTLKDLMTSLSHRTYEITLRLHQAARNWRQLHPPTGASDEVENPLEMDNFQDPQLASHGPLDMDANFTL